MLSDSRACPESVPQLFGRGICRFTLTAFVCVSVPQLSAAAAGDMRILHHQPIQIVADGGLNQRVAFEAYGRRFELDVSPNERIRRAMPVSGNVTMPLQGVVEGAPGSWVRITRSITGWRGMIYDGNDLYAIEPAAELAGATVEPLSVAGTAPVLYRLDDALLPLDQMACDVAHPEGESTSTASEAFNQLSSELHIQAASAEMAAMKQVRVGVVGDVEFVTQFAAGVTTPEDAIVARMNIVDGIFSSQVGVKISLATPVLFRTNPDPFTKTKALDLLTELRTWRSGQQSQLALGISHLMTGRDLDGDTVGIAYIGAVCDGMNAASLSEGRRTTTQSALIAAHEIGHNFGAPHDGESGACSSVPQTMLMAPRLNGSNQFSSCSLEQMRPIVSNAKCLTSYLPPDAGLVIPNSSVSATVSTAFSASFSVQAFGDGNSNDVSVTATLPSTLTVQSVTANGGTCTSGAGTASCTFGTLSPGDARQVELNLMPSETGSPSIALALSSSNDGNSANNTGTINVAVTAAPAPTPPATGGSVSGSSGGGGGGGRLDLSLLALLLSATAFQATRRARTTRSRR